MTKRGDVWWGPAPHKASDAYRPWLLVSGDSSPFAEEEAIALAMTTTAHDAGIPVPDEAWIRGGSQREAFISPWYVTTIKHRDCDERQGALRPELVDTAVGRLREYVGGREE